MSTIPTNLRLRGGGPTAAAAFVALTLQACGGGHNPPPPPPTVQIAVNPTTITVGQTAALTWSSTNATSCTASNGWAGSQPVTGSATEAPTAAGTVVYTITCYGAVMGGGGYGGGGGTPAMVSQSATLTVNPAPPPPPTAYAVKALVSNVAGAAATVDPNLVNPWGLVFAGTFPVWTANNGTNTSTLYNGTGTIEPPPPNGPLVVNLPASTATPPVNFQPTGIVAFTQANSTDFTISATTATGTVSGPAVFMFSGLGGQLAGWAPNTGTVSVYTDAKACYRGLALASNGTGNFLYANDFPNAKIDVFDKTFAKQPTASFPFADPNLPTGFAPFNIQAVANGPNGTWQLYVSYAMLGTPGTCEDIRGAGLGLVNVYDASGNLVTELVKMGGPLNAPWGMALAPSNFGTLSGMLLVSNHADGTINAFDPVKGTYIGALQTTTTGFIATNGTSFAEPQIWGIAFGNGTPDQPANTLFFTAGPPGATAGTTNGLYGRIDLPAM